MLTEDSGGSRRSLTKWGWVERLAPASERRTEMLVPECPRVARCGDPGSSC